MVNIANVCINLSWIAVNYKQQDIIIYHESSHATELTKDL